VHLSALSCGLIYSTCLNPALVHPRLLRIWKEKLLIPTTFQTGGRSLDQGRHGYVMLAEKGVATEKNVNIALQRNTRWVSGFQRCGSVPVFKRHCCWEWIVHPAERTNQLDELDLQKSPEYHQTSGNYVDDKTLGSCLKLVLCTSSFAIAILLRHICPCLSIVWLVDSPHLWCWSHAGPLPKRFRGTPGRDSRCTIMKHGKRLGLGQELSIKDWWLWTLTATHR